MKRLSARGCVFGATICAFVLVFISLAAVPAVADASGKGGSTTIMPNETVQSALQALLSTNSAQMFSGTVESLQTRLDQLRKMAGQDKDLVLQLLYYRAHAKNQREAMLFSAVVEQLAIPDAAFADAGLCLLDSSDESTRRLGYEAFTRADHAPKGGVDFSRYEGILHEKKQNPPQGLIRYMYDRNAQAALLSMSRVYGDKAIETEVADKLKGDPKAALQSLAERPEWWARLYVAETMKKQPQLRDAAILKKLETDDNPLVKEKAAHLAPDK
jgi:hypothetical protein